MDRPKSPVAQDHERISNPKLMLFAAIGAVIAAVLDGAVNKSSNSGKYGEAISRILGLELSNTFESLGILFVVFVAVILVRMNKAESERDAFTSGLMIFSTLVLVTPLNDEHKVEKPATPAAQFSEQTSGYNYDNKLSDAFILAKDFETNATIQNRGASANVSSCKPSYYGLFGLGSLINNSMKVCPTGHMLSNGTKVFILDTWQTGFRGYYYAQIKYQYDGQEFIGWISKGNKTYPNLFLEIDEKRGFQM